MSRTQPNAAHRALAALEACGVVDHIITQNVDSLHHKAGSERVLELHGSLRGVHCLQCGATESRAAYQDRLQGANVEWLHTVARAEGHFDRPDFDVELQEAQYDAFSIPGCHACGSDMVKPTVVFYGGHIEKQVTARATALVEACDALLVMGSSLPVQSVRRRSTRADRARRDRGPLTRRARLQSARLARVAKSRGARLVVVNIGDTRADAIADMLVPARCSDVLSELLGQLGLTDAAA